MISLQDIASLIDLTLLDSEAKDDSIVSLAGRGKQCHVAALCVLPRHLDLIPLTMPVTRATVVNFPTGREPHDQVMQSIENIAIQHQVEEIDYVFPWQAYLDGDVSYALSCVSDIHRLCHQHGLLLKVILETGALPSTEVIYQVSTDVIKSGCDFIKSSTGKIATGATIQAATAMLSAIVDSKALCGIKMSGGIRTIEQAMAYIQLAGEMMGFTVDKSWFRLGASVLLDEIMMKLAMDACPGTSAT